MTDIRKAVEGINGVEIIDDTFVVRSAVDGNCVRGYAIKIDHIEDFEVKQGSTINIFIKSTLKSTVDKVYKNGTNNDTCPWRIGHTMATKIYR